MTVGCIDIGLPYKGVDISRLGILTALAKQFKFLGNMYTKRKRTDGIGFWLQDVILDKLIANSTDSHEVYNDCMKYETSRSPDLIVGEVIESEYGEQYSLQQYLPLPPTTEQLSALIDPKSPRHKQLAAVFQLPDLVQSSPSPRPRSSSVSPSPYSLQFIHSIESDCKPEQAMLEEPRGRFFRTATNLNNKLEDLNMEANSMLCEMILLKHGLQELESNTESLLQQTKQLREDLQDLSYLDDLIHLLNGQLDRITLKRWPFSIAHSTSQTEMNLVI